MCIFLNEFGKIRNNRFVKRAFGKLLDDASWMDAAAWQMARRKLAQMQANIGYFRQIEDEPLLNALYGKCALNKRMAWAEMFAHVHRRFYLWPTMDYQVGTRNVQKCVH